MKFVAAILVALSAFPVFAGASVGLPSLTRDSWLYFGYCVVLLMCAAALPRFPGNPMLLVFKGMAELRRNRPADAAIPLREAASQTADPAAAALANDLLAT